MAEILRTVDLGTRVARSALATGDDALGERFAESLEPRYELFAAMAITPALLETEALLAEIAPAPARRR